MRLEFYRKLPDMDAAKLQLSAAQKIQREIWRHSVSTSRQQEAHVDAAKLLLPALNEMIDITTTRTMAMEMHPPVIIFILPSAWRWRARCSPATRWPKVRRTTGSTCSASRSLWLSRFM